MKKLFLIDIFWEASILVAVVSLLTFSQSFELRTLDFFRASQKPHPDITILAIDNNSLQKLGRWPWDRKLHAQIINKLNEIGPRLVVYDVNFSETQNFENDQAFKQALDQSKFPVVLASQAVYIKGQNAPARLLKPVSYFWEKSNVSLGHVNVPESPDSLVRDFPQSLRVENDQMLPLAFQAAKVLNVEGQDFKDYLIDYVGGAASFPTFAMSDFLSDSFLKDPLKDKIVLIGATAEDLHDTLLAPVEKQVLAGVEWHANVIDNILLSRAIQRAPSFYQYGIGIMLGLMLLLLFIFDKAKLASKVFVGMIIGLPVISFVLWRFGVALPYFNNLIFVGFLFSGQSAYKWYQTEMEKRRLRKTLQFYFSPAVLKLIEQHPEKLKLGGDRKEVTILFSDIRSFTTITETTDPEVLSKLLHEYFTQMTEEIMATDGVLDKFIGDAVMAFWGAPVDQPDQADRAVRAALGMVRCLKMLQGKWQKQGLPFVDIGIGINTGMVTVGNMGSEKRFDYTVIGDSVNAASRLEGLNKEHKTHIIISQLTKDKLAGEYVTRELGKVLVKGKNVPIKIFEVIS